MDISNKNDSVFRQFREKKRSDESMNSINSFRMSTSKSMESFYEDDMHIINEQIKNKPRINYSSQNDNIDQAVFKRLLLLEKKCESLCTRIEELEKERTQFKDLIFYKNILEFLFCNFLPKFLLILFIHYLIEKLIQ